MPTRRSASTEDIKAMTEADKSRVYSSMFTTARGCHNSTYAPHKMTRSGYMTWQVDGVEVKALHYKVLYYFTYGILPSRVHRYCQNSLCVNMEHYKPPTTVRGQTISPRVYLSYMTKSDIQRAWDQYTEDKNGCWISHNTAKGRVPVFSWNPLSRRKYGLSHARVLWYLTFGEVPYLWRECGERRCVRPDHFKARYGVKRTTRKKESA